MKKNLLIVLCDQMRRQSLGFAGGPSGVTPVLDQLAAEGCHVSNACSTYPVCVPFRYSLMTGQSAHSRMVPTINWRMSPDEKTLADVFNDAGYFTWYIGKWHLYGGLGTWSMKKPVPREFQGRWQHFEGFEFRNDFFDNVVFHNDDPTPIPVPGYQTDGLTNRAIQLLDQMPQDKPFCGVLSVEAPHPPIEAPDEYEQTWLERDDLTWPKNFMVPPDPADNVPKRAESPTYRAEVERRFRIYHAMIQNLDDNMGRLLKALKSSGRDKDTCVVFLSDHGELLGSHGLINKQHPYEESIGIPLIAWGPDAGIPAGRVVAEPTCTEDLFPTFCGLAGIDVPQGLVGEDTSHLIRGEVDELDRHGVMLEFVEELRPSMPYHGTPYRGWRGKRYKYIVRHKDKRGMLPWQFFDLEKDPDELNNLINEPDAAQHAGRLHSYLRERMSTTGDHAWLAEAYGHEALNPWDVFTARG